jgi:hypothetical protein
MGPIGPNVKQFFRRILESSTEGGDREAGAEDGDEGLVDEVGRFSFVVNFKFMTPVHLMEPFINPPLR